MPPPLHSSAPFVIIGGGMAGDAAARGIRMVEEDHPVVLLSDEPIPPYDRPPLSKSPLSPTLAEDADRETRAEGVEVRTGVRVAAIHRDQATLELADGELLPWRALVLAPGARPVLPPWARDADSAGDVDVLPFRTLHDARRLRGGVEEGQPVLVLGGGFVGTEVAAALARAGHPPVLAYPEAHPLSRVLPDPFPRQMGRYLSGLGVGLRPGTTISGTSGLRSAILDASGGGNGSRSTVVLGLGVEPRVELARGAGLAVGPPDAPGIEVDGFLATSDPRIRAAGDAIRYPCPFFGGARVRTEHEDHANESGVLAGAAAAGQPQRYSPVPSFHSSMGDLVWEGVGRLDPTGAELRVEAGRAPTDPGVALLRRGPRPDGVVVWNRPGRVPRIKRLLADPASADVDPDDGEALAGRIVSLVLD